MQLPGQSPQASCRCHTPLLKERMQDLSKPESFQMAQETRNQRDKLFPTSVHTLCCDLHGQEVIDSSLQVLWLGSGSRDFKGGRVSAK